MHGEDSSASGGRPPERVWWRRPPVEQQIVHVGGARVAYETRGAGPPLVLIHGIAGSSRWWRYNVPALARRFQVHTVNLLGFGGSRGNTRFALDEATATLDAWMRQVVATPAALAGHSMGGLVAADLASAAPELVSRLVLVNAAALPLGRRYVRHAWGLAGVLRYTRLSLLPVLLSDSLRAGPRTMVGAVWQILNADISPRLGAIRAPTLVVWGQHDRLLPLAMGREIQSRIPGAGLAVIAGAGHNPMWERPTAFNQVVLEFLEHP
jgi:pimeloyl-ACP methyl ester carboxylesterase